MAQPFRAATFALGLLAAGLVGGVLGACGGTTASDDRPRSIESVEQIYQEVRALADQIEVTRSRGAAHNSDGVALADLIRSYAAARGQLQRALVNDSSSRRSAEGGRYAEHGSSAEDGRSAEHGSSEEGERSAEHGSSEEGERSAEHGSSAEDGRSEQDARAWSAMRHALDVYLPEESIDSLSPGAAAVDGQELDCRYDPEAIASGEGGYEALSDRIYACFSRAAHALTFEGERTDRLSIFSRLPLTDDAPRRERLWRAMAPIWQSVNGDNGPGSPYRTLIRSHVARMQRAGEVLGESLRGIGVEPEVMEQWLIRVLQMWRDITPDEAIEPWDFAYRAGRADRALSDAISLEALRSINDRFYRDLGADPIALEVRYDVEPRAGKDPVAFTTFGRRARFERGAWRLGEPWVFASYAMGGLGNLLELLHETGHAVHIAAIRTRPAFADWPDSDIFTEGVADIVALEMYEPEWQRRYIGTSVAIEDAIAAKYAAIAMDIAWALFEVRIHRAPERDPNEVWGEICQQYFRIEPHPDLAWWAVRGQLIDAPGYMMNYAAGAILVADLRARARELYGSEIDGDPNWYGRISERLYRFGLEKGSKEVVEAFLGRPVSPQALLDDMARAVERENAQAPVRGSVRPTPAQQDFERLPADGARLRAGKALRIDAHIEPESVELRDEDDADALGVDLHIAILRERIQERYQQPSQLSIREALNSLNIRIGTRERPVGDVGADALLPGHLARKVRVEERAQFLLGRVRAVRENPMQTPVKLPRERSVGFDDQFVLAVEVVAQ